MWYPTGEGNEILQSDDLLISFNPKPGNNIGFFKADNNSPETALKFNDTWFILNGDFRVEYEQAFPDLLKCYEVYQRNIEHRSSWSTPEGLEDIINLIEQRLK